MLVPMSVEKVPDEFSRIRTLLSENPEGLTIGAISGILEINRNSAAKNLKLLQMQGRVTLKRIGTAKIYCPANKLPVDAVMKLSNNGVIVFSKGEAVADINEPFRELLQMAKQDLVGKTTRYLPFPAESLPELSRLIRDGLKGKESRISVKLVLHNRSVPCMFTLSPVFFENGDPGVALIADIPAGTRYPDSTSNGADDSLSELDMSEYVCRFTPDGTLTYVNGAYADLLQKEKKDLVGHRWRPTVPESEYKKIRQCLLSLDRAHPVTSLDFKAINPQGDSRWQRWKFRILSDKDGTSAGYQGTGTDITGLKLLEEKVSKGAEEIESLVLEQKAVIQDLNKQIYAEIARQEKTNFQLQFTQFAMDNASHLIMWTSRSGRLVYVNREAQQVLGYPYREMLKMKFPDIIAREFPSSWDNIWEAIQRDQQYATETILVTHDGYEVPVEMVLNYLEFKGKQYCCCLAKDISDRKRAEEALQLHGEIVKNLAEGVVLISASDGKIVYANPRFESMFGYDANELAGRPVSAINAPGDKSPETVTDEIINNLELTGTWNGEVFNIRKDGTTFWCYATVSKFNHQQYGPVWVSVHMDITDRKRVEEALLQSEARYKNISEATTDFVFSCTRPGRGNWSIDWMGGAVKKITGYTIKELRDMGCWRCLVHPDDTPVFDESITNLPMGASSACEIRIVAKSGMVRWLGVDTKHVPPDGPSSLSHVFGGCRDITERRLAEEALRNREHDFSTLVENATDMIVRFDTGLRYLYCNPAVERQMGLSSHQLVGRNPLESGILVEEGRFIEASLRRTLETGAEQEVEQTVPTPNGLRHFMTHIVPEYDIDCVIVSLLAITRDITDRKLAEEVLREKSRDDLKATSDSLQKTEADLQLHQTELEMQNEELRQSQANLERSRERYFELYDLAPAGYLTLSRKGLVLNANFTAATLLGVERQNLVNMPLIRFIVQDDQAVFYACRNELIETGTRQSCELHMQYSDGSPFRVQVIAVQAPASEGDDAAISLMLIDITGRKQTDEGLQKREKIFGVMFESHDSVMLLIDPGTGTIIDANLAAERFYGRSRENLSTLSIDEINTLPSEEVKALLAKVAQGQITSFTAQHRCSSGEIRTVEVHSSPIALAGKTVLFSIIHDITDRKAGGGDVV